MKRALIDPNIVQGIVSALKDKGADITGRKVKELPAIIRDMKFDESLSATPHIGDVAIIAPDGSYKFLTSLATTEQCINATKVGVVYDVEKQDDGSILVRVVGDNNTKSYQWSAVADYQITSVPKENTACTVTLNGQNVGVFEYIPKDGSIEDFVDQLDNWLKQQPSTSKAAKWEAYVNKNTGKGYLQMFKYDEYESTVTITDVGLTKLIGSELASYTNSSNYNMIGQNSPYCGMSRDRLEAYCKTNTTANCNPTTEMNGVTKLYETFPCSEKYFDSELGVSLQKVFGTYQKYLDACMVDIQSKKGILQFTDGEKMTKLLAEKLVRKEGTYVNAYPAAHAAMEYGTSGREQGKWWLPSMYELSLLMRDIRVDQKDPINIALGKCGYDKINPASTRWSSCRYSANHAWICISYGFSGYNSFCNSLPVSVVSAFKI